MWLFWSTVVRHRFVGWPDKRAKRAHEALFLLLRLCGSIFFYWNKLPDTETSLLLAHWLWLLIALLNKVWFGCLVPYASITPIIGGEGKRSLLNGCAVWGSVNPLALCHFLLQNTERSQPPPGPESVSRHPAPFLAVLLGPKAVTWTDLCLSSFRRSHSLRCALVRKVSPLPGYSFLPPRAGAAVRSL